MKKHVQLKLVGQLHNSGIRFSTMSKAYELEIKGWIKRISPGEVIIDAEGYEFPLRKFIQWCKKGPPGCIVESSELTNLEPANYESFEIIMPN